MNKALGWILRYRVLHVAYWGYALVSGVHELQIQRPEARYALVNYLDPITAVLFQMLAVYTCIYVLLPRTFAKGRYVSFALACAGAILGSALLIVLVQMAYVQGLWPDHVPPRSGAVLVTFIARIVEVAAVTVGFITVLLIRHYYLKDRLNQRIEQARMRSELDFLRAQMNPHFLFNALNSIYVLMQEDRALAERTLLRFSALLRYQLYACSGNSTTVEKEIAFLRDYVELEKVRHGDAIAVTFAAPERVPHYPIAPFILIPFVENAFKHLAHSTGSRNRVDLLFAMHDEEFRFSVRNTCDAAAGGADAEHAGIGLRNVRRRVQLLYPGSHELRIAHQGNQWTVNLSLHARDD